MSSPARAPVPEELHPSLWRASQMARAAGRVVDTGHLALSTQLPGGGWPTGVLVDLHAQQPGIGELRLLGPALASVARRTIVLVEPPHAPQALALAAQGVAPSQVLWIRAKSTADSLWAVDQVLRSGSCGAVLFWQKHIRSESLRRLHLAAQHGETLFWMVRPLASAVDSSPAPLRLSLRPAPGEIDIGFVKRQGPRRDEALFLPLPIGPARHFQQQRQVVPARPAGVPVAAREHPAAQVQ